MSDANYSYSLSHQMTRSLDFFLLLLKIIAAMKIRGLVNLITGGCSGFGLATARRLVNHGSKVVILDINEKAGAESVKELGSENCHFIPCDVTDEEQVKRSFEGANKVFGDVRMYLNSAGILRFETLIKEGNEYHDMKVFRETMNVNLFGSYYCTKYAAWHMKDLPLEESNRGLIINLPSVDSKYGSPGIAAYSASKGALEGMLMPVAREMAKHKIRVVNISAGSFLTPMWDVFPEEGQAVVAKLTLQGSLGKAEQFAQFVQSVI